MKVELLAPAGSIEAAYAAFANGSDAIYLAGPSFGARAYANNFSYDDIIEIIKYAHIINKKVYITVNTLIFENEINQVIEFLDFIYKNDCDAVIVQDLGLAEIIKRRYPDLAIHASTQMNIHTFDDAKKLKELGYKRIVMARETPLDVIKDIKEKIDIEIEVFVHGALCVSYSGNCYFSSFIGKRSGNRGRCAQPCRKEYSVLSFSKQQKSDWKYYLSPKDLCTLEYINKLKEYKVDSLKIEGRMKRPEYVAQVVKSYFHAINGEAEKEKEIKDLKKIFNRDFTKGFTFGEKNNNFINLKYQNHQGILIGKVVKTNKERITIKLLETLNIGDSIRIVGTKCDAITVNNMYVKEKLVKVASPNTLVTILAHEKNLDNANVFLTTSIKQLESLHLSYDFKNNRPKVFIDGICYLKDDYMILEIYDGKNKISLISNEKTIPSEIDFSQRLYEQINKTKESNYEFKSLEVKVYNKIIPIKEVNHLRREAFSKLDEVRAINYHNRRIVDFDFDKLSLDKTESGIIAKVSKEEQLEAALLSNVKTIYVDNYNLYKKYSDNTDKEIIYVLPRINPNLSCNKAIASTISKVDGNNTSVYMNVTNSYSAYKLFSLGAKVVGLSVELSEKNIIELIDNFKEKFSKTLNFEIMVYGRYELMISKYCPLQKEYNCEHKNCNMCTKNDYYLVDRIGYTFPITKGDGCYTKILNSRRVHLLKYLPRLKEIGIKRFVLDFSIEDFNETKEIIQLYNLAFNGIIKDNEIDDVTYGHFNEGVL